MSRQLYSLPVSAAPARWAAYLALNAGFVILAALACALGGPANPRLIYLISMFALCSHPLIDLDRLNGHLALLAMFMFVYFVSYGALDFTDLFAGNSRSDKGVFDETEAVIVVGGLAWVIAYRLSVSWVQRTPAMLPPRDWRPGTVVAAGLVLWAIGTFAVYTWSVYIVPDTTNDAVRLGLARIGTLQASANILGQMLQPLGLLLLAYAMYAFRSRYLLPVVVTVVLLQVALGFVVDIKGMAMLGGILVIITCVLVTGRLPKTWLAAGVAFVIFVFPIFTAYRTAIHGDLGLARTAVIANFSKVLRLSIAAEDRVNTGHDRAQTFLERATVKGSTEMIVERTGNGVGFQAGHTLTPILTAFLPRILWSDKPDIPTGQLVNKEFHLSESTDVYISPSHLGELYWNFGWPGVLLGMASIGFICGYIGTRCNMSVAPTVTRLLVLVVTIKQLIVSFEGALGSSYVVWLRSLAAVAVLHVLFAQAAASWRQYPQRKAAGGGAGSGITSGDAAAAEEVSETNRRPFPNLLT